MSWDHLSSKALVHIQPDATIVWNDVQKHEVVDMHGIREASVVVTGRAVLRPVVRRQRPARWRERVLPRRRSRSVAPVLSSTSAPR